MLRAGRVRLSPQFGPQFNGQRTQGGNPCGYPLGKSRCAREYNPADNRDPGDQGFNGLDVRMVLAQRILKGMAAVTKSLGPLGVEGPAVDPTAIILGLDDQQRGSRLQLRWSG